MKTGINKVLEKKVIYQTELFEVIELDKTFGIEPFNISVVIIPFEKDSKGLPKTLGILKEYNPIRTGNFSNTLITGITDGEDPDFLETSIKKLKEVSGYITNQEHWHYLGLMTGSKIVKEEYPCFAVDVTDLKREIIEKEIDVEEENNNIDEFIMMPVKDALNTDDSFIPTLFMKMFKYIFNVDDINNETDEDRLNNLKKKLDVIYLLLGGVISSSIKHDIQGDPYIEYLVDELTDHITETIPKSANGINITIKPMQTADKLIQTNTN